MSYLKENFKWMFEVTVIVCGIGFAFILSETRGVADEVIATHEKNILAHPGIDRRLTVIEGEVKSNGKVSELIQKNNQESHDRQDKMLERILRQMESNN